MQKAHLILVEDSGSSAHNEADVEERKRQFLEKLQTYSIKLPEDYKFDRAEIYDRNGVVA